MKQRATGVALACHGLVATGMLTFVAFSMLFNGSGSMPMNLILYTLVSCGIGAYLAALGRGGSLAALALVAVPPAGLMALLVMGILEELEKGAGREIFALPDGLWYLVPLAIALPPILIPHLVRRFGPRALPPDA